jgi:acetyl-CoA synthase
MVEEADALLQKALAEKGPDAPVQFPNTAYYLPVIYGFTAMEVSRLGDLPPVIDHARKLLHPVPRGRLWTPYLGEALDCGVATLFAEEAFMGVKYALGEQPERLDIGCAKSNEVAVQLVRELQRRNILVFLSGNVNGRSIIHQLLEEGVEMGYDTYIIPFGTDTISTIYPLGFATRSGLTFGGLKPGQARENLVYNKFRVFAMALALGEIDDLKYATAAGAISYGFPAIADTVIPEVRPTGVTEFEHVISMPFDDIDGKDDLERAEKLIQKCIEVRGVKVKIAEIPIPVPYGSAFEGERVRKDDMRIEFGGKKSRAFEYLRMADADEIEDGKIELIGPDFDDVEEAGAMDVGIVIEVGGRKMQKDIESVLERQIHYFLNAASGVQHIGQRDIAWIRISKTAAEKGFTLKHFGEILYARFKGEPWNSIVDKAQVKLITDPEEMKKWIELAREAYSERNVRVAGLTDEGVDEFYSCTLCQSFAPTHVCVISPQRLGLCGAYNWLDCKAAHQINPTGPNQPIAKGELLDPQLGRWSGPQEFVHSHSNQSVEHVTMYSIMTDPMTACGCFECMVLVIPESNGVMIVSREDPSMTPAGMTFSTMAGMFGGGLQTPGAMGVGKYYLTSPKFISADGGFKRVVWMSSFLKESMPEEFREVAEREGVPDLIDRIADERNVETVDELLSWLEEYDHPALKMDPIL